MHTKVHHRIAWKICRVSTLFAFFGLFIFFFIFSFSRLARKSDFISLPSSYHILTFFHQSCLFCAVILHRQLSNASSSSLSNKHSEKSHEYECANKNQYCLASILPIQNVFFTFSITSSTESFERRRTKFFNELKNICKYVFRLQSNNESKQNRRW